jgi:hypothetical protein
VLIPGSLIPEDVNRQRARNSLSSNIFAIALPAMSFEALRGQREGETSLNFRWNGRFLGNALILRPPAFLQQPVL